MKSNLRSLVIFIVLATATLVAFNAHAGKRKRTASGQTVLAPAPATCSAPGTLVVSDPTGDQTGGPAANQQFDIQSISIAEPCLGDGANRLTFTIKVADLSSVPANGHWKVKFAPPTLPSGITAYFVEMASDQSSNVTYDYGTVGTTTTTVGTADDGTKSADGTITITVANSKVGNPAVGQTLNSVQE